MYRILYFSDLCGYQSSASLHYLRQLTYSQPQITSLPVRQHLASAKLQYKLASIQATRYIIHLTTHGSAPQRIAQRFALEKSTSNRRGGYENGINLIFFTVLFVFIVFFPFFYLISCCCWHLRNARYETNWKSLPPSSRTNSSSHECFLAYEIRAYVCTYGCALA